MAPFTLSFTVQLRKKFQKKEMIAGFAILLISQTGVASLEEEPIQGSASVQSAVPAPSGTESQQSQNNRMNTLLGSNSRWSGQLNLTYLGSSISHPFSSEAPNPGNVVPPPLVTLSGTVSARYRMNERTTMGIGAGLTTQTPFQGPKNTTVSDPYLDFAHFSSFGPIRNRTGFQMTLWSNNQFHQSYGYRYGLSAFNESFYVSHFGLTAGLAIQADYNFFAGDRPYDSSQQIQYDIYLNPYFEYKISSKVNLRSVIGIASLHTQDLEGFLTFYHPNIYQTFGVGIAASKSVFVYPFIQFFPLSGTVTSNTVLLGFNTIINLF